MAKRSRKTAAAPAAHLGMGPQSAASVSPTAEQLREARRKIDLIEEFKTGEVWTLIRKKLERRADTLRAKQKELLRVLTFDNIAELARLEGRAEENEELMRFPDIVIQLWKNQIEAAEHEAASA